MSIASIICAWVEVVEVVGLPPLITLLDWDCCEEVDPALGVEEVVEQDFVRGLQVHPPNCPHCFCVKSPLSQVAVWHTLVEKLYVHLGELEGELQSHAVSWLEQDVYAHFNATPS